MALDLSQARLRFLKEAAFQLATTAPNVSANLASTYIHSVMDTEEDAQRAKKEWGSLQRELCGACGSVVLPGWSSSVRFQSGSKSAKKPNQKPSTPSTKLIVSVCLRCDRKCLQSLQPRKPKHVKIGAKQKIEITTATALPTNSDEGKITKSANATSKQRKKSRKGGLQAMLEKNKSQKSGGGLGLDLMDFMQ